jgi:hypothetical protein
VKRILLLGFLAATSVPAQIHRAEQDREIHYWLLDPETHLFKISQTTTFRESGRSMWTALFVPAVSSRNRRSSTLILASNSRHIT